MLEIDFLYEKRHKFGTDSFQMILSLNMVDGQVNAHQEEVEHQDETPPARRNKRKLFSTNCSYLDENELDNQQNQVSPVRKKQTINAVIEEEEVVTAQKMDLLTKWLSRHPRKRDRSKSSIVLNPASVKVKRDPRKSSHSNEAEASTSERAQEKENLDKDHWYKLKYRTPFTRGEEEDIVKYFLDHGGFSIRGGNTVWKKMEEDWVCPGRTWHSLRERFVKHIKPHLRHFGLSKSDLLKADRAHNISKQNAGRKNCNFYSKEEDLKIISFIVDNKRFLDVGGNELWKLMEERAVLDGRSWQSMKERFRKVISPKINQYKLDKIIVENFVNANRFKKEKRIK